MTADYPVYNLLLSNASSSAAEINMTALWYRSNCQVFGLIAQYDFHPYNNSYDTAISIHFSSLSIACFGFICNFRNLWESIILCRTFFSPQLILETCCRQWRYLEVGFWRWHSVGSVSFSKGTTSKGFALEREVVFSSAHAVASWVFRRKEFPLVLVTHPTS